MTTTAPAPVLGNTTLLELLGRGGMGEVWLGERVGPGGVRRRVAVKRLLPRFHAVPALRQRFVTEARVTARLEHPNVVQLIEFGDEPELYLVLEYVPGVALDKLLRAAAAARAAIPLPVALYLVAEAAEGLDYAHRLVDERGQPLGVVHRDVSPQNVLVSTDGAVKVSDFGIARAADSVMRTMAGTVMGKASYMAPEQAVGYAAGGVAPEHAPPVDKRADVFALGVVLWELLTLRPLFPRNDPAAADAARARGDVPPPSRLAAHVPPELDAIVLGALAVDPAARTPSCGRMAAALRAMLHARAPGFGPRELARYVAATCPEVLARGATAPRTAGMASVEPVGASSPEVRVGYPEPTSATAVLPAGPSTGWVVPPVAPPTDAATRGGRTVQLPLARLVALLSGATVALIAVAIAVGYAAAGQFARRQERDRVRAALERGVPPLVARCARGLNASYLPGPHAVAVTLTINSTAHAERVSAQVAGTTADASVGACVAGLMMGGTGVLFPMVSEPQEIDGLRVPF